MPNIKSAGKRLRSDAKKRTQNKGRKASIKFVQKSLAASLAGEEGAAKPAEALSKCFAQLDKAAKVGAIHKNKANRKKSRLLARVRKQQAS